MEDDEVAGMPQWFPCPSCDRMVTGLVLGTGPANRKSISRTHCCHRCARGASHDDYWCCSMPRSMLRTAEVRRSQTAHYFLHEPDWARVASPVPALLWLHGALTFIWPEALHLEVQGVLDENEAARGFVVVAPLATRFEPLAVASRYLQKQDRYGNEVPYVESFDAERTWECFLCACRALGPARVDFTRLCVTGYSMGSQSAWDLAVKHGSQLAAVAPLVGRCYWPVRTDDAGERYLAHLSDLPIRSYSCMTDTRAYSWKDFAWLAQLQGLPSEPSTTVVRASTDAGQPQSETLEVEVNSWGETLQLGLVRADGHNCWDFIYRNEDVFGLFTWLATVRENPRGAALAMFDSEGGDHEQ